jgi:nucleoside-diphosphate-sugar epimerase
MFVFAMRNNSIKKIAVLGCGWLGLPLAKILFEDGYTVNGSTTSVDKLHLLEQNGIIPFHMQLEPEHTIEHIQEFLDVDLLIINIPPGRSTGAVDSYLDKMNYLKSEIVVSDIKKVIFVSSTSVYSENNAAQTEESKDFATSGSAMRMLKAEHIFTELPNVETTIIRMAGLIDLNRHPGRFFAGKSNIANGLAPINLIHLDDCIGIVCKVINDGLWNEVYNGAAPSHPPKMDFYGLASKNLNGKPAEFIAEEASFKIVDSEKIISKGYQFKHPDLMEWLVN